MLAGVVFPPPGSFNIGRTRGNTFVGGAQQVAAWQDDGTPMIGWRSHGAGTVIAINLHVITSDTAYTVIDQPWAIQLFVNAANFTGAVCGNGTTEGGEACDEGAMNGTPASCCDSSCQLRGAGELCRGAADACDAVETCDGASGACPTDVDLPDGDADGTCDAADNCPSAPNAGQENADGDAFGDACDPCVNDADDDVDADGVCGDVDNCPAAPNAGQENADGDALGDVCDACPSDPANDVDADGVCGDVDNCPVAANAGQEDADGDALGDACDTCTDTDADGYDTPGFPASTCDEDNCPSLANPAQADLDADGEGDLCDAEDAVGLSLRKLQVRKVPQPGKDKWSGQGDLATTATPTFLEDVDAGGLSVTLTHDDGTPVDAVAFTGSDCVRRGVNLNSMRCRDAAGNQVKLSKRPASSFFRIVAALKLRSLVLPTVADSPMRMAVTSPVAIDRVDGIGGCKAAPGVLKCADLP